MSSSYQKVILLGNLGKDPEVKYTPSGMAVAKFSIATSDRYKDKSGEWQEKTEWHNLVAFDRTAEVVGEYLKKGSSVFIEGKLQTSNWEDKDTGKKVYRTEIIVNDLKFAGGKSEGGDQSGRAPRGNSSANRSPGRGAPQQRQQSGQAPDDDGTEITDEDIPF